jgi:hypothetical protein
MSMDQIARDLHTAMKRIAALEAERDEARTLVMEANNSLYGSQGYFHSLNGGAFDPHHLSRGIENLKRQTREQWQQGEVLRSENARLREALDEARDIISTISHGHDVFLDAADAILEPK